MSYSFGSNGWDLFNTPFSTAPVRTAPASPKQQAERSQQKPSEAMQRNHSLAQEQKTPPLSHSTTGVQPKPTAVQQPNPALATPFPAPKAPAPVQADNTKQEPVTPPKAPVPASTQPVAPQKELVLDMSSGAGAAPVPDDTGKRKAHEEAEAKRRAEWEAKQKAKKQAEEAALQQINSMSDEDVIAASVKRIGTDTERLTRRNMKECVAVHIQELCRKDTAFARKTMHPRKSMIRCFKYINRMARDYVKQEMEDNDIKPDGECMELTSLIGCAFNGVLITSMPRTSSKTRRKRKRLPLSRMPALPPNQQKRPKRQKRSRRNKRVSHLMATSK